MIGEHPLNETGKRGTIVKGEKLIDETTRRDRHDGRWYRIQIISDAENGGYVIGTAFNTKYRGKHDHYWIDDTMSKRSIMKILESHIPEATTKDEIELREDYIGMIDRIGESMKLGQAKPVA